MWGVAYLSHITSHTCVFHLSLFPPVSASVLHRLPVLPRDMFLAFCSSCFFLSYTLLLLVEIFFSFCVSTLYFGIKACPLPVILLASLVFCIWILTTSAIICTVPVLIEFFLCLLIYFDFYVILNCSLNIIVNEAQPSIIVTFK